jgi:outer membrane protein assembly factor BamB
VTNSSRRAVLAAVGASFGLTGCLDDRAGGGSSPTESVDSPTGRDPTRSTSPTPSTTGSETPNTDSPSPTSGTDSAVIDAVDGAWRTDAHDAAGTRYDPDGHLPDAPLRTAWTASHQPKYGDCVVDDGTVAVVDESAVTAFESTTGERLWHRSFDAGAVLNPNLGDDALFVSVDDAVVALDRATGRVRWRRTAPTDVRDLVLADGVLFSAGMDGTLRALVGE